MEGKLPITRNPNEVTKIDSNTVAHGEETKDTPTESNTENQTQDMQGTKTMTSGTEIKEHGMKGVEGAWNLNRRININTNVEISGKGETSKE
jgi:hypothetical protein